MDDERENKKNLRYMLYRYKAIRMGAMCEGWVLKVSQIKLLQKHKHAIDSETEFAKFVDKCI
jgi:hypothetical protein